MKALIVYYKKSSSSSASIAGESLMGILLAFVAGAGIQSLTLDLTRFNNCTALSAALGTIWLYTSSKIKIINLFSLIL